MLARSPDPSDASPEAIAGPAGPAAERSAMFRNAQRHYGDPNEPDDTAGTATHIGTIGVGVPVTLGDVPAPTVPNGSLLSIDANGEQDWFRFTITDTVALTVTVTPIGLEYDSTQQTQICGSGNFIDSLVIANLSVSVYNTDGTTVMATASSQAAGLPETISGLIIGLAIGGITFLLLKRRAPR